MQSQRRSTESHGAPPTGVGGLMGWAFYDWANSAFPTLIQTFVFAAYFTRQVAENETVGTTQWGNTLSAAGLVIALTGPILGAITDQSGRRKPWILGLTLLCVGATACLWFVQPSTRFLLLGLVLVAVGTIGAELAVVFYNAMLPDIAPRERVGRWSGWAWGLGYAGGLSCLALALFGFVRAEHAWFNLEGESARNVRATFVLAAGWYLVFSLPLFFWTPDEPRTGKRWSQAARDGVRQLWDSARQVRRYAPLLRFLIARMIFIDGLTTMFAFGGVFTAGTFKMTEQEVLVFGIALNVTAGLGAAAFAWLDDGLGGKWTILVSLAGLIVSGTSMLLAPDVTWFWVFGLVLGIFTGPVQAASRSYLARLAPEELRNQMFGLFAFSGKATAFLGPLLVGWITYVTGSQRWGMSIIIVFFVAGLILMWTVPSDKGRKGTEPS